MNFPNIINNRLLPAPKQGGFAMDDYWIWCGSVIKANGKYHMFASRWPRSLGEFGSHWLFSCEVVRAESDTPEGSYMFAEIVLPRRERKYFDGMNTTNPYILSWNGKYYLYYIGTTYAGPIPQSEAEIPQGRFTEVWNQKRIGLAVSDSIYGPWVRSDEPLLLPRDFTHWDCTITSNPAVTILPDGTTYMIYKSRTYFNSPLMLGVAKAPSPAGPFVRISDEPIFNFDDPDLHVEDPFLWYQDGLFHMLVKDDRKNNSKGLCNQWGAGVYARSKDCIHWDFSDEQPAYSRNVLWDDGSTTLQPNTERPFLLRDESGYPTHLYLATGDGDEPYHLDRTYNMCIPLK